MVQSCKSATAKKTITTTIAAAPEDPLACLASLTFEEESNPFSFPHLVELPRIIAFHASSTNDGDNNNNKIYHIYNDKYSINKSFKGLKPILPSPYQPWNLRPPDQEKEKKKEDKREERKKESYLCRGEDRQSSIRRKWGKNENK
jgi:hypothetical protein